MDNNEKVLAQNNLAAQLVLLKKKSGALDGILYCVKQKVGKAFDKFKEKAVINQKATTSSEDYASLTLSHDEYYFIHDILLRIHKGDFDSSVLSDGALATWFQEYKQSKEMLELLKA